MCFFDTTLVRMLDHFITAWKEWKSRLITQPLLVWKAVNPPFLLLCLTRVDGSSSKSFLSWSADLLLVSGWTWWASLLVNFGCAHWCFCGAGFFSSKSGIYKAKREGTQGTHQRDIPWALSLLAHLSSCLNVWYKIS